MRRVWFVLVLAVVALALGAGTAFADSIPPVTTISGGPFGVWMHGPLSFKLASVDGTGGTGVAATYYAINGGGTQSYAGTVTVSAEGTNAISYWSVDGAGNVETTKTAVILIDKTPPTITGAPLTSPNAAGWYNANVTVHFTTADTLSGIGSATPDAVISSEGASLSVSGWAMDRAGNSASVVVGGIKIDKTAPTITISSPVNGATYNLNQTATASWTATDGLSGIATASGTVANGGALDTSVAGTHTITVTATDRAGNTSTKSASYVVIASAPKPTFASVLAFFDAGVADNTIVGTGRNPKTSLATFRNILSAASNNYDLYVKTGSRARLAAAKNGLASAYSYCDGSAWPTDLVSGTNRAALASQIAALQVVLAAL